MMLSSCQLAKDDTPTVDPISEQTRKLVGVFIQITEHETETFKRILPDFGEEGAIYFLKSMVYNEGLSTTIFAYDAYGILDIHNSNHIKNDTINGVTTKTIIQSASGVMLFGPEVRGKAIDIIPLYEDGGNPYHYGGGHGFVMDFGENVKTDFKDEYTEDGIKYIVEFNLSFSFIDELEKVNVIEMDDDNLIIKSSSYDEPFETYEATENTSYVIFEEVYKNSLGELYSKRTIYERGKSHYIRLKFLVHPLLVLHDQAFILSFK